MKHKIKFSFLALVLVASAAIYFYRDQLHVSFNKKLTNYINLFAAKKLNAELKYEGLNAYMSKSRFGLGFKRIELLDTDKKVVLDADNVNLVLKWSSIFNLNPNFRYISAEHINVNAVREKDGSWNILSLLKDTKTKKTNVVIQELDFKEIDLNLVDKQLNSRITYPDLKVYWKQQRQDLYFVDIESAPDLSINKINIEGVMSLKDFRNFLASKLQLQLDITELKPKTFSMVFALLKSSLEPGSSLHQFVSFIDEYSTPSTTMNWHSKVKKDSANSKVTALTTHFDFKTAKKDATPIPDIAFDASIDLTHELKVKKCNLVIDDSSIALDGSIRDWAKSSPDLKLVLAIDHLNLLSFIRRFLGTSLLVDEVKLFTNKLAAIHPTGLVTGELRFDGSFNDLHADTKLELIGVTTGEASTMASAQEIAKNKFIKFDAHLQKNHLLIDEFSVPVKLARVFLKGDLDIKQGGFNLNINTNDLALSKLKQLFSGLGVIQRYQALLERSRLKGFTSLDLNLSRSPDQAVTDFSGQIKLAKMSFLLPNSQLYFQEAFADVAFNNDNYQVDRIGGYLNKHYFEGRGLLNLLNKEQPEYRIELAAKKVDMRTVAAFAIFDSLDFKYVPSSLQGFVSDFFLAYENKAGKYGYVGSLDFDDVSYQVSEKSPTISNLNGKLDFSTLEINADNLSFNLGKGNIFVQGQSKKLNSIWQPDFELEAQELALKDLDAFTREAFNYKLPANFYSGLVSFDTHLLGDHIEGDAQISHGSFALDPEKHPRLSKMFSNLDMKMKINNESTVELISANGNYASSPFKIKGTVKNLFNDAKPDLDFSVVTKLDLDEIPGLLPDNLKKYLSLGGNLGLRAEYHTENTKKKVELEFDLNELDHLRFSTWLDKSKDINAKIVANLDMTPHLIRSDDTKIILSSPDGDKEAKLSADFIVHDYASDNLNYFLRVSAPQHTSYETIEPNILALKPFNFDPKASGDFQCDTFATKQERETVCDFIVDNAIAHNYGIGDLSADRLRVKLFSDAWQPFYTRVKVVNGKWVTIPYKSAKLDVRIQGTKVDIDNIEVELPDGELEADYHFDTKTLASSFDAVGTNVPAHELAESLWKLGEEVPSGFIDGHFSGKTRGLEPDDVFFNMKAKGDMIMKDGSLSQLKSMKQILSFLSGFQSLDLNKIMSSLVNYKGGAFKHIVASFDIDKGVVSSKKVLLKAPQVEIQGAGVMDYVEDLQQTSGTGLLVGNSKSVLNRIGLGKSHYGKRFFEFSMYAPITDPVAQARSIKENFAWLDSPN